MSEAIATEDGPEDDGQPWWGNFKLLDENIVGLSSDRPAQHDEVHEVIRMLEKAGIFCCFVGEYALIYYGAGRVPNDRFLCISDDQMETAIDVAKSKPELLAPVPASPVRDRLRLHHLFPRFKLVGTTDFWLFLPSSFTHVSCEAAAIERSLGDLPYPNLKNYVEALLDTQDIVDLDDLIDAQDLSEEWGDETLDLDRHIDIEWVQQQQAKQMEVHGRTYFPLSEDPQLRRVEWEREVRRKSHRVGHKLSTRTHATRWRRHGSRDPRLHQREGF